ASRPGRTADCARTGRRRAAASAAACRAGSGCTGRGYAVAGTACSGWTCRHLVCQAASSSDEATRPEPQKRPRTGAAKPWPAAGPRSLTLATSAQDRQTPSRAVTVPAPQASADVAAALRDGGDQSFFPEERDSAPGGRAGDLPGLHHLRFGRDAAAFGVLAGLDPGADDRRYLLVRRHRAGRIDRGHRTRLADQARYPM